MTSELDAFAEAAMAHTHRRGHAVSFMAGYGRGVVLSASPSHAPPVGRGGRPPTIYHLLNEDDSPSATPVALLEDECTLAEPARHGEERRRAAEAEIERVLAGVGGGEQERAYGGTLGDCIREEVRRRCAIAERGGEEPQPQIEIARKYDLAVGQGGLPHPQIEIIGGGELGPHGDS